MNALLYVTKRRFINNLKRAVKKPASLILIIFCILYGIFIVVTLGGVAVQIHFDSPKGLVVVITIWTLYIFLSNFASYASRKGIIFKTSDAHFIFPAPISPKVILLHSAWMNYLLSAAIGILFAIAGLTVFGVAPWRVLLLFLIATVLEISMEVSVMVILYTNDRIPQKVITWIGRAIKVFLIGVTVFIILYFKKYGITLESASSFIDWPGLQMIPFVGWNIAAYRLVLLGPELLNIICTILYLITVAGMFLAAWRTKTDGGYYEDAAKFADDYAEMRKRKSNGEMVTGIGKNKRKFRNVNESFKATGAKAIFYRQLLEYKKEKYFIFSKMTLLLLGIALILAKTMADNVRESGVPQMFLAGMILYITLIFSGYLGKWEKELANPYLFLIPDSPVKKLWYATLMEHLKAFVDGCIFCIPLGIAWGISPVQIVLAVLTYTVLQANRMYTRVVSQCILGDSLGKTGQNMVRALIQMMILGLGAGIAIGIGFVVNADLVFPIILIYSMIVTVVIGLLASIRFNTMEQIG